MILRHFDPQGRPIRQKTNSDVVRNLAHLAEMEFAAGFLRADYAAR
jgi:hypothetical protein